MLAGTAAGHLCAKGGRAGPEHPGWERTKPKARDAASAADPTESSGEVRLALNLL